LSRTGRHDRRYAIDCSKAERELGFAPQMKIEQGLAATFQWYLDQESWWRALQNSARA